MSFVELKHSIVPTALSFDLETQKYLVGESAKQDIYIGKSNARGFKEILGKGDAEFNKDQTYFLNPELDVRGTEVRFLSAKDAARIYIDQVLSDLDSPEKFLIGLPTVKKDSWLDNYKRHIKEIFRELNFNEPGFYWEPFAVFQYFKNKHLKDVAGKQKTVLVIDIGGSTFNCCVVRSAASGYVAQGGDFSIPRARNGDFYGGDYIDKLIYENLVSNTSKLIWKEDPLNRLKGKSGNLILAKIEEAKINLCKKLLGNVSGTDNSKYVEKINFNRGELDSDKSVALELTPDIIESVIYDAWNKSWSGILEETINEFQEEVISKKIKFNKFDHVILSGGSSGLPFVEEHVYKSLHGIGLVNKNDIHILEDPQYAVAQGIAYEIKELSRKNPDYKFSSTSPCVVGDIVIAFRKDRRSEYLLPKVKYLGEKRPDGIILSSPLEIMGEGLEFEVQLPSLPSNGKLHVGFFDTLDVNNSHCLNLSNDIVNLDYDGRIIKKFKLLIEFEHGYIKPTFVFKVKGSKTKEISRSFDEISIDTMDLLEGDKFIGFDFGNSNSYLTELVNVDNKDRLIPDYYFDKKTISRLKRENTRIHELLATGEISKEELLEIARTKRMSYVYHSNKIENVKIKRGDTEEILSIKVVDKTTLSEEQIETLNLSEAYLWMIDNHNFLMERPKQFICELNRLLRKDLDRNPGAYRLDDRKPSGTDFEYPGPAYIESLMDDLFEYIHSSPNENPIEKAIKIHTWFVTIHPFSDGNGRTARLLFSAVMFVNSFPSIILSIDEKVRYITALENCRSGDLSDVSQLFLDSVSSEIKRILSEKEKSSQIEMPVQVGDSDDPFLSFISEKYDEVMSDVRLIYQNASPMLHDFISEVCNYIDMIKVDEKVTALGIKLSYVDHEIISEDVFLDFYSQNVSSFIHGLEIQVKMSGFESRLLYAFTPVKAIPQNPTTFSDICSIHVYRFNGFEFVPVDASIFPYDEIVVGNENLDFLSLGKNIGMSDCTKVIGLSLKCIVENTM